MSVLPARMGATTIDPFAGMRVSLLVFHLLIFRTSVNGSSTNCRQGSSLNAVFHGCCTGTLVEIIVD